MKNGQAEFVEQAELNSGEIAVGEKWLGVRGDGFEVEAIEQVIRSVAAANAHDCAVSAIGEGGVQIGEPLLRRSGEVERLAQKRIGRDLRRIAQ